MPTVLGLPNQALGSRDANRGFVLIVLIVYMVLGTINMSRHEMWRDEVQTWITVTQSATLGSLFHNKLYDGHPGLWYVVVYVVSKVTKNPLYMQILHLALAAASAAIFIIYAPFSKLHRALFVFGYFPLYEYATISRDYAIGVFLICAFCALYAAGKKSYVLLSVVLLLMMQTNVYGLMMALGFAGFMFLDFFLERGFDARNLAILWCAPILAAGAFLSAWQMIPPPDSGFARGWHFYSSRAAIFRTMSALWRGYLPLPQFKVNFWNTNFLNSTPMQAIGAAALVALAVLVLSSRPTVLLLYATGTSMMLAFMHIKHFGQLRHHGHLFILLISCLWLSGLPTKGFTWWKWPASVIQWRKRTSAVLLGALLFLQCATGLFASGMDWKYPFSESKAAAEFIMDKGLAESVFVGYDDVHASAVAGHMNRSFYYAGANRQGTFIIFDSSAKPRTQEDVVSAGLRLAEANMGKRVVFVLNERIDHIGNYPLMPLKEFVGAIVDDERYYLYLLE